MRNDYGIIQIQGSWKFPISCISIDRVRDPIQGLSWGLEYGITDIFTDRVLHAIDGKETAPVRNYEHWIQLSSANKSSRL